MEQQLLDDLKPLEIKEEQQPSWILWWFTIGTVVYLGIWLFPMRWLNYSVEPAYEGLLAIMFFVVLVPFFWAGAKSFQKGWIWGIFSVLVWLGALVIMAFVGGGISLDPSAYYGGVGEMTAVAWLLLVVEHHRHRSAHPALWTSIGLLAQAYLLQWVWIEILQYFFWDWALSTLSTLNLLMLFVPITLAFGVGFLRVGQVWKDSQSINSLIQGLLLLGLYVSWLGTGAYWYGDMEMLKVAQQAEEMWLGDNTWQERGACLRAAGLGLYLLSIAIRGTRAFIQSSWASN